MFHKWVNELPVSGLATETLDGSLQLIQVILQEQHVLAVDLLLAAQLLESPTCRKIKKTL